MNKKIIKMLVVLILTLVLLLSFTGCSTDNQELLNRLEALEKKYEDSQSASNAKITALEVANTLYKNQLDNLVTTHANDMNTLNVKITALEAANALYKIQLDTLVDTHNADIESLNVKITALESANALFQTQIVALGTEHANDIESLNVKITALENANATFATEISALTAKDTLLEASITDLQTDLDTLTASIANATHIERTVIKPSDVGGAGAIAKSVEHEIYLPEPSETLMNVQIWCALGHGDYSFNYQLITFNTSLFINDTLYQDYNIAVTQAKSGQHLVEHTFNTKIHYDSTASDVYAVTWSEIILYRFV